MLQIINPYTRELLQSVKTDTSESIKMKINQARLAFEHWRQAPLIRRMEVIGRFRVLLQDQSEELAQILSQEMGKPLSQARNEIKGTQTRIDFFLQNIEGAMKGETLMAGGTSEEKSVGNLWELWPIFLPGIIPILWAPTYLSLPFSLAIQLCINRQN